MVKFDRLAVGAAAAVLAAGIICGCSAKTGETEATTAAETTAEAVAEETTAATSSDAEETSAEDSEAVSQMKADGEKIAAVSPKKPDNVGTVELGNYKGLVLEGPEAEEVTDADVQTYFEENILPYIPIKVTDDTVKEGDTVNINYKGTKDGVEFDGGSAENYDLKIGSDTFIPGFEEGLVGKHYGETVTLDLTFPEDYQKEELAGQAVQFVVDINEIKRDRSFDQIDDACIQELTQDQSMTAEKYIADMKKNLQMTNDNAAKADLYMDAIDKVVADSTIEPSDEAIEWQMDVYVENYNKGMSYQYGMDLASVLYMYGQTYDQFRESLREPAVEATKRVLAEYAICEKEGLEYTDEAKKDYYDEFGYDEEMVNQMITPAEQELAVIGNLACKAVVDNAKEIKTVAAEETEDASAAETSAAESESETEAETTKAN